MFDHLDYALKNLFAHIEAPDWSSMDVTYHPPHVERLWKDIRSLRDEPVRLFLHRIHPCEPYTALWHPHPWPSAVELIYGEYEHGVGVMANDGITPPPVACTTILTNGSRYEMKDPATWHYVRPLRTSYTVMVCGVRYEKPIDFPKPDGKQGPLSRGTIRSLKGIFHWRPESGDRE